MDRINVERLSEILAEQVFWDEERFSSEEFMAIIRKAIEDNIPFYLDDDGEIDDWEMFEYDARQDANKLLGND